MGSEIPGLFGDRFARREVVRLAAGLEAADKIEEIERLAGGADGVDADDRRAAHHGDEGARDGLFARDIGGDGGIGASPPVSSQTAAGELKHRTAERLKGLIIETACYFQLM